MGYSTDFEGEFTLDERLTDAQAAYLRKFSDTRRMNRDPLKAALLHNPEREAVGLPVGDHGCYVTGLGFAGQDPDASILEHSRPPSGQPGLWCQWVPTADSTGIEWNGAEKFYNYVEWLQYLIDHFLTSWGRRIVGGEIRWQGEDTEDRGVLRVEGSNVVTKRLKLVEVED